MAGDNLMASGFQHHFRWNGLTRDLPEILAGYSIQTNKNAKEELEARPVFFGCETRCCCFAEVFAKRRHGLYPCRCRYTTTIDAGCSMMG